MAPKGSYSKPPRYVHPRNNPERFRLQMEALREQTRSGVWDAQAGVGYRLNAHLGDLANPHEVTTTQINAWTLYPDNYTGNIDTILGNEMGSVTRQVWWTRIGSATGTFPPGVAPQQHDICVSHKTGNTLGWQEYYSHNGADIVGKYIRYSNANAVWSDWQDMLIDGLGDLPDVTISDPPSDGHGIYYDSDTGTWQNHAPFQEAWPTGLVDGGELNIGPGVNDIEVLLGTGIITNSYTNPLDPPSMVILEWPQINEAITVAPSTAGSVVWFSIANSGTPSVPLSFGGIPVFVGTLKQYATGPSQTLARQEIFLGVAIHNGTTWNEVSNPKVINSAAETLREVATTVLPLSSIISGGSVTETGTFEVNQDAGVVWEQNRNWHNDKSDPNREALPAATPVVFQYVDRDFAINGAPTSTFDPDTYDNGAGPVAVPDSGNTSTIQKLYIDPANNYWVLYGQITYPNFFTAEANLATDLARSVIPFILQNSILLGYAVMEKGKNNWDVNEAVFIPSTGAAGLGGGGGTPITIHNNLTDREALAAHPVTAITDMEAVLPTATGDGIVWDQTALKWQSANLWVVAGYGGIRLATPIVGFPSLGAGWETLVADSATITIGTPRGITQSFADNTLGFDEAGVWSVAVSFTMLTNETNASRNFGVRIFNVTKATGGIETTVGIGRNTDVVTFGTTIQFEIPPANVGDFYRVEVGDGSAVTAITLQNYSFTANLVSEWRG